MRNPPARVVALVLVGALAGCTSASGTKDAAALVEPSVSSGASALPSKPAVAFPTVAFADIGDGPVSRETAADLQAVLDEMAGHAGMSATVMSADGTWSGATGKADGVRDVQVGDQFAIASITKSIIAAQVMQLVEAGELSLDDSAADHLPRSLHFDTNGARIVDLLSMRSGIPENLHSQEVWKSLWTDPLRAWTTAEVLATVGRRRGPVGQSVEYRGNNYLLLELIIEHVTGRPLAKVLRSGVLGGDGYERLIYQPDERPTEPMALPFGDSADSFHDRGRYLPTLAAVTAVSDSSMASDSLSLARWFRALCAGEVVSAASLNEMTDFEERPEYGLGLMDMSEEYGSNSGAVGHTGLLFGYTTEAMCFQDSGIVVAVLANGWHDNDPVHTIIGDLVRAAS